MSQYKLGILFAAITATCWAVLAIALKWTLHYAGSGTIVWTRMSVAFSLMFIYFFLKQRDKLHILIRPNKWALLAGTVLAINYFGYMKGIELTSAANAQIMIQMAPLSLALIGIFYFKESLSKTQLLGLLIACFGFAFFYWDQIILAVENSDKFIEGDLWITIAAAGWAIFATLQKILTKNQYTPQQLNLLIYGLSTLLLAPLADFSEFINLSLGQYLMMIGLGVNTIIAYGCLGEALKRAPASHVSLIITLNPLLTIFLVNVLQHFELSWIPFESIQWRGYVGAALVVSGVSLTVAMTRSRSGLATKS